MNTLNRAALACLPLLLLAACGGGEAPSAGADAAASHEQAAALAVPAVPAGRYVLKNVQSAKCVDAVPPGSDGGAFVQTTCSSAATQAFDLTVQAGSYKLVAVGTGRVMDLAASSTADGALIHQWASNDTSAQRFVLQRSQGNRFALVNAGSGKCVAIDGGSLNDGAGLRQAGCSASGAQQFLLYPVSTTGRGVLAIGRYALKAVHSGLCIDVENGSLDNGAKTAQAACNAADRQQFEVQPAAEGTYSFVNVNSGKGLDVSDISLDNGALIQQWAYGGGANQRFVVSDDAGALRIAARHSGRCVDVSGVSTLPGARIHQWDCLGAANQRWTPLPAGDTPPPPTGTWVGTWGASPQAGNTSFNQQTLRQIVHTSVGGAAARVHLSNVFGSQPITVANVHIAQRASGSAIVAASDRAVSFGGQATVVIPAGGEAVSDSIDFNVAALSDVAISFYLPNATTVTTEHQTGLQTNYVAAGNVSGNATINPGATSGSYRLLTNLDVSNSSLRGSVATLGASITDGVGTNFDANQRWPNVLANRLNAAGIGVGVLNQGISGNSSLRDGAGPSAENRFDRDVLGQAGVKWVIYSDDPINDLRGNPQPTLEQLLGPLQRMIAKAHARQVKFLCSTLTPYSDNVWTPSQETTRQAYNNFVKGSASGCDGVIDQDLATRDPANPARMLPANDTGDHLHPNTAGNAAIANSVNLNLFTPP